MSFDFLPTGDSKALLDFLIQVGVLLSFGIGFIGFVIRYFNKKLDTKIENKMDTIQNTLTDHTKSVESFFKSKEEIDRERFRTLKEHIVKIDIENDRIKQKIDVHLIEAAEFIGSTKMRLTNIEQKKSIDGNQSNP